jgi:hypothetical protein
VKLGNESTKFFRTRATISYRHNYIYSLLNKEEVEISDHDGNETIFLDAFKDIMGLFHNPNMAFNPWELF